MESPSQGPRTAGNCILAGLIALAVSACAGPQADPTTARQAGAQTDLAAQVPPPDPIKLIDDAMEEQIRLIVAAAHPTPTR